MATGILCFANDSSSNEIGAEKQLSSCEEIDNAADNYCYELAFEVMELALDAGCSPTLAQFHSEWAYCDCAPQCQWPNQ